MIEIVRHINSHQVLIRDDDDYYVVSENNPASQKKMGPEVLVFPAHSDGEVKQMNEVDGARGVKLHEFLPELIRHGKIDKWN